MKIRKAVDEDINNNLLNLFVDGYQLHYENRKDKFTEKEKSELQESLIEMIYGTNVIVVEENNIVFGYLSYQINKKSSKILWIDQLVIDSEKRHQGLGKLLLDEAEKIGKQEGCSAVELCCWSFNETAKEIYQHLNYQEQRVIYEKII